MTDKKQTAMKHKALVKLSDYNKEQTEEWEKNNPPKGDNILWNGIQCPMCQGMLADKNICRIPTKPPRIGVYCPTCRFEAQRVALQPIR